jgi:acetylornithine deacetylase/succinyl-diaminopimelate desuccinylase-like protein
MLEERFQNLGLNTSTEWFSYDIRPAERALRAVLILSGLLIAVAGLVASPSPVFALVVLVAAVMPGLVFLSWSPRLEKLYRRPGKVRTANVVGRIGVSNPRLTLILMAHHDSKSQSLTFPFRMGLTILAIGGILVLAVVVIAGVLAGGVPGPVWLPTVSGVSAAIAASILSTMRSGDRSPGGVDNAGSVAILLELARILPARLPENVELVALSTGAEEDHMVGAMRWLDAHAEEYDPSTSFCLNFDGAGAPGRVVLIERYGFGRLFSATLSTVARRVATRLGMRVRGILMLPAMGIDAIPFARRGLPCLTLSSGSLDRATMSVHSASDHAENLDAETLAEVTTLAAEVLLELARDEGVRE